MEHCRLTMDIWMKLFLVLTVTYHVKADLSDIVDHCCALGSDWSQIDTQCYDFPQPIKGIEEDEQNMCATIVEVCCLKSRQTLMCENGKTDSLESQGRCVVRSDEVGAVTYKECCHCCNLGTATRAMGMQCTAPGIGNPCDQKFIECCTGNIDDPEPTDQTGTDVPDIDECAIFGSQRLCGQVCTNTIGSYRCDCNPGYTLAADKSTCFKSIPTCASGNNCSQTCIDTSRGPLCTCKDGFRLLQDRQTCEDIDECRIGRHNCLQNEKCVNTNGNFTCESIYKDACTQGYVFDELTNRCIPIPDPNQDCQPGFAFNLISSRCEDIDECIVQLDNCDDVSEVCQNSMGSFYCACEDGFRRSAYNDKCEDIDECASRKDTCMASERCENTVGSYSCRRLVPCGTGWTLDEDTQQCVDQNECDVGTHNCRAGYECFNLEGSFRCNPKTCPTGYRFSAGSGKCELINCPRGLRPDSSSRCVDVDECTERQNACRFFQQCVNSYGSFRCIDPMDCAPGYELDEAGVQCVDINECKTGAHDCDSSTLCINRRGSFTCSCPPGFRRIRGQCVDKDECQYGLCPYNSNCENTEGSYICTCNPGLEQKGQQCVDIDECQVPNRCQHRCVNVIGSYQCTCNAGYQLSPNKRSCVDVDECNQYGRRGRLCGGNCINTPGSYECTCPAGWRVLGNGRSCQDIDECAESTDGCKGDPDVMCFNTRGSHKCPRIICPQGFSRSSLGPRRNRGVEVDVDDILCVKTCEWFDTPCLHNETMSVSYQFMALPTIRKVKQPTILLNITAEGFFLIPQMFLHIMSGNEDNMFDTVVNADTAIFRLLKPIIGPTERKVMLRLENRDYIGNKLISAHNTHLTIDISNYEF